MKLKHAIAEVSQELLEIFRRILIAAIEYQLDIQTKLKPTDLDDMLLE